MAEVPYTTIDNLKKRVSQKSLLNLAYDPELGGSKSIDDATVVAQLSQAIVDATDEIEGYLRRFTTVPIADATEGVPGFIERVTAVIAIYNLYQKRLHDDDANPWADAYDNVIEYLKKLTGREFQIDIEGSSVRTSGIQSNALDDSGDAVDSAFTDRMW